MEPRRAAESDHGELPRVEALLEQRQTYRCPETGIGDDEYALRRGLNGKIERLGDLGRNRSTGRGAVEPHVAAEETLAIEPTKHHVRVCDGRSRSAAAVARRPRV